MLDTKEDLIQYWSRFLKKLTSISSETDNICGVNQVQKILKDKLSELNLETSLVPNPELRSRSGHLLVAQTKNKREKYITLICHADTVYPLSKNPIVSSSENKIFGSGIIDNKGGVTVGIYALSRLAESNDNLSNYGIRFICSPNEEMGSPGFQKIFADYAKDSEVILGLEPALENGDIISSRKGNRWYDITFEGQSAHAGRHHAHGVNACAELAIQMAKIHELTNYDKNITVNVGKIEGGEKHNIVSDKAYAQLDVRFPCFESREVVSAKITDILESRNVHNKNQTQFSKVSYEIIDDCPPLAKSNESKKLFEVYKELIKENEKISIKERVVGGAADANYFSSKGKVILDGLGPIGSGMHTENEYIEISSLKTRGDTLYQLIKKINQGVLHETC